VTSEKRVNILKFGKEGKGSYGLVIPSDMLQDSMCPIDLKRPIFLRFKEDAILITNKKTIKEVR